jgi:hypothetical protein
MSKVPEAVLGWALGTVAFFENIKSRRGDDELTARYKALQRACVRGTVLPLVVGCIAVLVGNAFNAFSAALQHSAALEGTRMTVAYLALGALAFSGAYCAYCYWKLWRFVNEEDQAP